ncbi:MAG TPA: HAMP domain-containing sensor histidine kinase [Syntrophomonadaceae bacterium]|nr:HAMP domain-containing sensor histidine kinase [Syntrophomonadaceae bacterium]
MQKNITKRLIYTRVFSAFFAIYLLLMTGFSIFVISEEQKVAGMEFRTYANGVNNRVAEILQNYLDSNNQVTDLVSLRKELVRSTSFFTVAGTEIAVFTGDYQLLFHTNNYWIVQYDGGKQYGYLNPREWFSDEEISELEYYLTADFQPKKAGDLWHYTVDLRGFWLDQEMVIPGKITVNPMYADTFDEQGHVTSGGGTVTDEIIYTSRYQNTRDLPYFEHGNISPATNSKKHAELRQLVTDAEQLKETEIMQHLEHPSQRIALTTYRYYLPMPYQNTIHGIDQKYYSDFWTVIARDINMWERCSTTLVFVWISCLVIFLGVAFILSRQTYKTYREREELEKQRQEMTDALAHDLKTPLSIISGYAQNLQENIHTEKREHYAAHILSNVERMDKIIRSMLEMTRLESDFLQIKREELSLAEASNEVIGRYRPISQEKSLTVDIDGEAVIKADHAMIERVIDNFFVNALGHTPEGGSISIRISGDRYEIYNSGSHIPEERIKEIWLPFKKSDLSRGHSKGTGLGLAIARTILELHGFSYGAQNCEDGVVFWFKFQ